MKTRTSIIILSVLAAISYGGYFWYQSYKKKQIDARTVTLEEALKMLQAAKAEG